MIILGVDPGTRFAGYGVIAVEGRTERLVEYGVLDLDVHESHALRLKRIYDRISEVIDRCLPDECALEMPVYGRNPQSMLKLGRAQAAAMLAVLNRGIPATEYTPKEVKKSVTGKGNASKEQVAYMVGAILEAPDLSTTRLDAADALAVALCHAHRDRGGADGGTHKDWSSFLKANPNRWRG